MLKFGNSGICLKIKQILGLDSAYPKRRKIVSCDALVVCAVILFTAGLLIRVCSRPEAVVVNYPVSGACYDAKGELMYATLSRSDEWCLPVRLELMGSWLPAVAVNIEDRRFYTHHGVDILAVARAAWLNMRAGRVRSGASTITAQVVRIATPRPRTPRSKAIEFLGAWMLESSLPKRDILELYLNRAPFGGNLRGVEAASRAYFGKAAELTTLGESALLIGLLRAPSSLRPDRYPGRARKARDGVLRLLVQRGAITKGEYLSALREPVVARREAMPRKALLASRAALRESPFSRVDSTIDPNLQGALENTLEEAVSRLPDEITASAVVIDNTTREVKAYVGNARYGRQVPASFVDCAAAPRSPGSTLKPFLYALAFADGTLTPASLLADTPIAFQGAAPRNYDLTNRGPVSARTALALSLNAPAVRVLRRIGYGRAIDLFRRLGFSYMTKEAPHYADSLVLGGCEVSVLQLAAAYAALAGGGEYARPRMTRQTTPSALPGDRVRVYSQEAAYLAIDVLRDERRRLPLYSHFAGEGPAIAFKTGTSHGMRDAWTAACTKTLTVAVWFGDPSGRSHAQLVGLDLASPAALKYLAAVRGRRDEAVVPPQGVYKREVCSLSGALPRDVCPHIVQDYAIRDVSSQSLCDIHVRGEGGVTLNFPDELRGWMQMRTVGSVTDGGDVRITRPPRAAIYDLMPGKRSTRVYVFSEGVGEGNWYLNGRHILRTNDGEGGFIEAAEGQHKLSVLIGERTDTVFFEVRGKKASKEQPRMLGM